MSLIPLATRSLLELFQGPLRDVHFPDADAERLEASVDAVMRANDAVTHAEAALAEAREALAEKQRCVAHETERTLAYARIYASERPELRTALDAVTMPSTARRPVGRPRKAKAESAELPKIDLTESLVAE